RERDSRRAVVASFHTKHTPTHTQTHPPTHTHPLTQTHTHTHTQTHAHSHNPMPWALTCATGSSVSPHGTRPGACRPLWRRGHRSRKRGALGSTCPPGSGLWRTPQTATPKSDNKDTSRSVW